MDRVGEAEKAQIHTEVDILKSLTHKVKSLMECICLALRTQQAHAILIRAVLIRAVFAPSIGRPHPSSPHARAASWCTAQHILTFFAYFDLPSTKQIVFITEIMTSGTLKQ